MPAALEIQSLVCAYTPDRRALDGVSMRVEPGEVVGLLGPNGSGKSTLFKVLATLMPPTDGSARVFGHDVVTERAAVRRNLGVIFQHPALDKELTGRENLACHGQLLGMSRDQVRQRSAMLLEAVDLADRADEPTKRLSGGMRRRLEIAKSLLSEPPLLLMDEPTTGLDPGARRQVWDLLERLRERTKAVGGRPFTLLVTTHLMDEAARCGRLILLNEGRTVVTGSPRELTDQVGVDVVTLVLESPDDAPALAQALVEQFGERAEHVSTPNGAVRIERQAGHELVSRMMSGQETLRIGVREASVGRPTLEDVFLRLTGRGLNEK